MPLAATCKGGSWKREEPPGSDAEYLVSKAIDKDPKVARLWIAKSRLLVSLRRIGGAIYAAQQALDLEPQSAECHAGIAGAAAVQERFADAEMELRKAVELEPYVAIYQADLAGALLRQGKRTEAIRFAQEAKRLGLQSHWVYKELGLSPD